MLIAPSRQAGSYTAFGADIATRRRDKRSGDGSIAVTAPDLGPQINTNCGISETAFQVVPFCVIKNRSSGSLYSWTDTPNMLRGEFYSTHSFRRCTSYKQCPLCTRCQNYTPYYAQCIVCETRKRPTSICECTPETIAAKNALEARMKGSLIDQDRKAGGAVEVADVAYDQEWRDIVDQLNMRAEEG